MRNLMKVSVVIPTFNEEKVITNCLNSLAQQTYNNMEVIVIDDGSTDSTLRVLSNLKFNISNLKLLSQDHKGPGEARNLGAKESSGDILVFVDADMEFENDFIEKLIDPIISGESIGTFSKEEFVLNKDNVWSKCWNINKKLPTDKMHGSNYPKTQQVFRAILKEKFEKIGGFTSIGYIDDYTLAEKSGVLATAANGAKFYHKNPDNLGEIYQQARWVGKSEFKRRKINNETLMKIIAIIRYSPIFSLINGIKNSLVFQLPQFLIFKFVYDFAVEVSLFKSFWKEQSNR